MQYHISLTKKTCLFIFTGFFFLLWTIRVLLYIAIDESFTNPFMVFLSSFLFKLIIWVVPVILYIVLIESKKPLNYLRLNTQLKQGLIWSGIIFFFGIFFQVFLILYQFDTLPHVSYLFLNVVFIAPCIEELTMRGFFLSQFDGYMRWWKANILTSLVFVLIHYPGWIIIHHYQFIPFIFVQYTASIFFLSLILGWTVRKTGSLYPAILLHMIHNIISL